MDRFSNSDLRDLMDKQPGLCVSLYCPTHPAGREVQQDPIRFKNLLRQAEESLVEAGLRAPDARALLAPGDALLADSDFWRKQSTGLAFYASAHGARHFRLPLDFNERVVVGERFYVKPLLPLISGDGRFFVLALSQGQVRLLQADRRNVAEVDVDGLPRSLDEALKYDDEERQLQVRSATPGGGAMFHGHGAGDENQRDRVLRFCQAVDRALQPRLADSGAPLVLAAVDSVAAVYREANTYAGLQEEIVPGSPDALSARQLHEGAWPRVEGLFQQGQEDARGRIQAQLGTGLASTSPAEIVSAAAAGRVDALMIARGSQTWGIFDPDTNAVTIEDGPRPGNEELCDRAAVETLLGGGQVFVVEPEMVPGDAVAAALFRY